LAANSLEAINRTHDSSGRFHLHVSPALAQFSLALNR
jgi:hypothetical protein